MNIFTKGGIKKKKKKKKEIRRKMLSVVKRQ